VVVLALAPAGLAGEARPSPLVALALVAIHDEIRPDIAGTIRALTAHGVDVKVISGDHPHTVASVAARAGIPTAPVITEAELTRLSGAAFDQAARETVIFARITPETKRAIIAALTRQGCYVAMVGDGINDVPALKQARLGVAMNDGAQIAKDVSDLVLLENTLSTLPVALAEGRAITQKIFVSARLYLARNGMTVLAIVLAGFAGVPFPAEPRQISWNATIGVVLPCMLLAFDLVRPAYTRSFARGVLGYSVVAALVGAVVVVAAAVLADLGGADIARVRTVFALTNLHFALHVFLDATGVSVFSPSSVWRRPGVTVLAAVLLAIGAGVPMLLPGVFNAARLAAPEWLLVLGLPFVGRLLLRLYGPFVRGWERALGIRENPAR
jgi:cation-transporting ATPase E